jgi:hypothetical protein
MRSLNTLFVAFVAMVVMCLTQVGYTQFPSNIKLVRPTPPLGQKYHDGHAPSEWEVGRVYERMLGSDNTPAYTGPIHWEVRHPSQGTWKNSWASGECMVANTNIIRVPYSTMQDGDVYWLTAELDGEFYIGRGSNGLELPTANPVWTRQEYPVGTGTLLACPTYCHELSPLHFYGYYQGVFCDFADKNKIYLHPRSTVNIASVPRDGSRDGLRVRYSRYDDYGNPNVTEKLTNNGTCYFNVNYNSSDEGFAVLYDGCWHPIPSAIAGCNALCFVATATAMPNSPQKNTFPEGRVTLTIKQYDVPLPKSYVWVLNSTGTKYNTPQASPLVADDAGKVYFTPSDTAPVLGTVPASGKPFALRILIGNEAFITNTISAPAEPADMAYVYQPTHIPALISPPANGVGTYFTPSSTIPFSWGTVTGASTYILWLKQGANGAWQGFNVGNSTSVNLSGAGLGTWYWDIEVRNSTGQVIAASVTRTFIVNQTGTPPQIASVDLLQMDDLPDNDGIWDNESSEGDDSLTDEESNSIMILQDEDENVLSPTQGLQRAKQENKVAETVKNRQSVPNDDWWYLFMTPEEQLFYDFWFGSFGNL